MKKFLLVGCTLLLSVVVFAQGQPSEKMDYSKWEVRLRFIAAVPPSSSYNLSGSDVKISAAFVPELDFTYFFTKNLAAELILGTTQHSVKLDGAGNDTKLGSVWLLPPTLNLQYHVHLQRFRPYAGVGVNYSIFYSTKNDAAALAYKNEFGFSGQIGTDIDLSKKWFINIDIKKILVKTDVTVNQTTTLSGVKVNPYIFGIGVGTRF